jgi:hypothetical protein
MKPNNSIQLLGLAYLIAAALCICTSQYRALGGEALTVDDRMWPPFSVGLFLMAVYTLVGGEQVVVLWLRGLARVEGWYELRRPIQLLVLVILLTAGAPLLLRMCSAASLSETPIALVLAVMGMGIVGIVFCVCLISYHYADTLMNLYLAGLRVSRWLELSGLGLVCLGALRKLMFTYSLR